MDTLSEIRQLNSGMMRINNYHIMMESFGTNNQRVYMYKRLARVIEYNIC